MPSGIEVTQYSGEQSGHRSQTHLVWMLALGERRNQPLQSFSSSIIGDNGTFYHTRLP